MDDKVQQILQSVSNQELADHMLETFQCVQKNYFSSYGPPV
jgi:hypothetical protein